ncbi:hypothetical protein [Nodularia sphaerocarpa]|uniref:hypothetical protein n=1 Tax=Nodularia sphaerocarpa TaxID=137816 RepID=UPI001EFB0DE0|nr:hypothetical protein [Nodularia sphaerocarpa]MDB9374304.1 hypothetical protein [Nodularia sphaerocarpa CS-585]MDB9377679.1 hypothetical protein [Nodularia sphaerocarpa CS-585A2]ULP74140.1 hypothetical protein BDGGKGIB_03803 [Nodularia sphaerocarpa UHCC 0038]
MTTYCANGQTATLLIPGEIEKIYQKTPITVECFSRVWVYFDFTVISSTTGKASTSRERVIGYLSDLTPPPYRISNNGSGKISEFYWDGGNRLTYTQNRAMWVGSIAGGQASDTWIFSNFEVQLAPPPYGYSYPASYLRISDSDGLLFQVTITNAFCNYEVECSGCEERQMDCGDCCLDCDSIFNLISSLRKGIRYDIL